MSYPRPSAVKLDQLENSVCRFDVNRSYPPSLNSSIATLIKTVSSIQTKGYAPLLSI